MSRFVCILLIITLLCCTCGCSSPKEEIQKPVNFYYCNNPITFHGTNDVIAPEVRESVNYNDMVKLIDHYLDGPISEAYTSPFPSAVTVSELTQKNKMLNITLSSEFSYLTGIELTLACTCLSSTLFELTDAKSIIITAKDALLDDAESVIIIRDTLVFSDSYTQSTEPTSKTEE